MVNRLIKEPYLEINKKKDYFNIPSLNNND